MIAAFIEFQKGINVKYSRNYLCFFYRLRDRSGREALRDIVQFVPFRNFKNVRIYTFYYSVLLLVTTSNLNNTAFISLSIEVWIFFYSQGESKE